MIKKISPLPQISQSKISSLHCYQSLPYLHRDMNQLMESKFLQQEDAPQKVLLTQSFVHRLLTFNKRKSFLKNLTASVKNNIRLLIAYFILYDISKARKYKTNFVYKANSYCTRETKGVLRTKSVLKTKELNSED